MDGDHARLARYREYRDFYDGVQWLGRPRRGERRLTINYARALVRKVVSYALPGPVSFTVADGVGSRESEVVSRHGRVRLSGYVIDFVSNRTYDSRLASYDLRPTTSGDTAPAPSRCFRPCSGAG